jgi:PTS system cellobiose-specific IIB component
MATLNVMLCCGAGMSSGFLASNARKAVKKGKLDVQVEARSHAEVADYLSSIDVLLLGPHYATELDSYKSMAEPFGVKVAVIPADIYGALDGKRVIEFAQKTAQA